MRISKFMLPALTVAGALALAGCGGSDSMPDTGAGAGAGAGAGTGAGAGASGFTDATLPASASGIRYNTDNQPIIQLAAGKDAAVGSSNVSVSCPATATAGCRYRVTASNGIEVTGGATVVLTATIGVPAPSAAPASGNWLSASNLVGALNAAGTEYAITVGGVKQTITVSSGAADVADSVHGDPKVTGLKLRHNRALARSGGRDFLVWGVWKEPVAGAAPDKPHQVSGGSISHGKPTRTIGTATYTGNALGHVTGITGISDWAGTASLTADFEDQTIDGSITPTTQALLDEITSIQLGDASIDASLSGKATIRGLGAPRTRTLGFGTLGTGPGDRGPFTRNAPSDGTWAGAFYGPTTGDPTGVAGSFSVKRDKAPQSSGTAHAPGTWHDPVGALSISGAFGADCTGSACGSP